MSKPQHGGPRPPVRPDDGRLGKKPGCIKLVKLRFNSEAEEQIIKSLTPRQRVEACVKFYENKDSGPVKAGAGDIK